MQGCAYIVAYQSALPLAPEFLELWWCQANGGFSGCLSLSRAAITGYHGLYNL